MDDQIIFFLRAAMQNNIKQENILFTGGSGLLGAAFKKIAPAMLYPPHDEFEVVLYEKMRRYVKRNSIRACIHAAAFTSPPEIDTDPVKALMVNIVGTSLITRLCMEESIKLIYISTDYVFRGTQGNYKEDDDMHPVNKYAWSKLGGECAVRLYDNSLIIRTSFGPDIFPYDKAFIDQWTSREPVSVIAKKIYAAVKHDMRGVIHIGGPRRTVFEYANSLRAKDLKELSRSDVSFAVPADTSLDSSLFDSAAG